MSDEEHWVLIPGFDEYAVSDQGRVQSVRYKRILNGHTDAQGRRVVGLRQDGRTHFRYVHRLVAEVFLEKFHPRYTVKQRQLGEGIRPDNLEFARGRPVGTIVRRDNKGTPIYRRIRIVETGEVFMSTTALARYLGIDESNVRKVLRGERPHCRGYTFEYFESS